MRKIKVGKRDGRIEDFDQNKLHKSLVASGASDSQAKLIVQQIMDQLNNLASEDIVDSQKIREMVIGSLEEKNPQVAKTYQDYQKSA